MGKTTFYAIGDVHGMSDMLESLMKAIHDDWVGDDIAKSLPATLVFLGDYIDRGPNSRRVLEIVRTYPGDSVALVGNHEEMMLQSLARHSQDDYQHWIGNGGQATLDSYTNGPYDEQLMRDVEWLDTLPYIHEAEDIIFVHGGIDPRVWPIHDRESCLWTRSARFFDSRNWDNPDLAGKLVVHGHTPVFFGELYRSRGQRVNCDYGAVYGSEGFKVRLLGKVSEEEAETSCLTCAKIDQDRNITLIQVQHDGSVTKTALYL